MRPAVSANLTLAREVDDAAYVVLLTRDDTGTVKTAMTVDEVNALIEDLGAAIGD